MRTHIDYAVNETSKDNRHIQKSDPLFKQESAIKGNTMQPPWVVYTPSSNFLLSDV